MHCECSRYCRLPPCLPRCLSCPSEPCQRLQLLQKLRHIRYTWQHPYRLALCQVSTVPLALRGRSCSRGPCAVGSCAGCHSALAQPACAGQHCQRRTPLPRQEAMQRAVSTNHRVQASPCSRALHARSGSLERRWPYCWQRSRWQAGARACAWRALHRQAGPHRGQRLHSRPRTLHASGVAAQTSGYATAAGLRARACARLIGLRVHAYARRRRCHLAARPRHSPRHRWGGARGSTCQADVMAWRGPKHGGTHAGQHPQTHGYLAC
mmetsp:Transcript_8471/g.22142  ORF Transcript_8471/g.22142 Transcript_8471/m.22142 type:complete len:266 (+) Transcript_8471:697-1494(+)